MQHLDFVFCDLFLFYSEKTLTEFTKLNKNISSKLKFWGYLKASTQNNKEYTHLKKAIYFTQPYEYEIEDEILTLLNSTENLKVYLKLHPRDDVNRFKPYNNLIVIDKTKPFDAYIPDFDLAITRVSSVGLECILYGIPTIYCLHSSSAKKVVADYIDQSFTDGISYNIDGLKKILDNYAQLSNSFALFRSAFIKQNSYDFNLEEFENQMSNHQCI
jgi:predicted glycosyltransferase